MKLAPIKIEGGNIIIELDKEGIEKEVIQCSYEIIGRITYQKGDKPYSTPELQTKLQSLWKILKVELAHIGKGFYYVFMRNAYYQSMVMSMGTQSLKSGFFRVSWWVKDFISNNKNR